MSFDASLRPFEFKIFTYFVHEKQITLTVTYLLGGTESGIFSRYVHVNLEIPPVWYFYFML